jgi:Protein of unknown function (DUF4019)
MNATIAESHTALRAALRWLDIIDRGELQAAFRAASSQLQTEQRSERAFAAGTTEYRWCIEVGKLRVRLGALRMRRLEGVSPEDEFAGGERSGRLAFRFTTTFAWFDRVLETILLHKGCDGIWRVSGYRIVLGPQSHRSRAGAA